MGDKARVLKTVRNIVIASAMLWSAVAIARICFDLKSAANDLPHQIEMARREGLATEPSDLRRQVAAKDNAAPSFRRASDLFDLKPYDQSSLIFQAAGRCLATGEDDPLVDQGLRRWAPALREAIDGSLMPDCNFDRIWQADEHPILASDLKTLAKLLCARGVLQGRLTDIEAAGRIARHIGKDPSLSGARTEAQCEETCLAAARTFARLYPSERERIRDLVDHIELPRLRPRLGAELVLARERLHRAMLSGDSYVDPASEEAKNFASNPIAFGAFECRTIELYRQLNRELAYASDEYTAAIPAEAMALRNANRDGRLSSRIDRYLLPELDSAAGACLRLRKERIAALGAIQR